MTSNRTLKDRPHIQRDGYEQAERTARRCTTPFRIARSSVVDQILEYFPDTDTLCIALRLGPDADADEVALDVILDYDANGNGNVIGFTIEYASERAEWSSLP